ncbi:hypothetical protein IFR05_008989 [Cadophora sp. M221]|nr:hypothetical protein IFR05_008989 [Cadophora sp. M221]
MAPSITKIAGIILLAALPSLGKAASQTCALKDSAPVGSICGPTGVITNFDYFVEDLYDVKSTSVLFCASKCAGRSNCKSFNIRTEEKETPFCELHTGTQSQAGFIPENDPENTASSYQGFDLSCFTCVDSNSTAGAQSTSSGTLATSMASSSSIESLSGAQSSSSQKITSSSDVSDVSSSSAVGAESQSSTSEVFSSSGIASSTTSVATLASSSSTSPAFPTTTPYICNEDNCYRALLRFGNEAKDFCSGYTATSNAETASVPAYLDNCSRNPVMISSGCSCLATWISPDPPPTLSSPSVVQTSANSIPSQTGSSSPTSVVSGSSSVETVSSSLISTTSRSVASTSSATSSSSMTTSIPSSNSESMSRKNTTSHRNKQITRFANSTSDGHLSTSAPYVNSTMSLSGSLSSSIADSTVSGFSSSSSQVSMAAVFREVFVPTTETKAIRTTETISVTEYVISTVYSTSVHTFTECPLTVKVCHIGLVTTTRVLVTTTLAPIIKVGVPRPTITFIPPGYAVEPIYKIHVDIINECPSVVKHCLARERVTRTIEAGSAVCPCATTDVQVHREERREKVCYQAQLPASEFQAAAMHVHNAHEEVKAIAMPMHTTHEEVGHMPMAKEQTRPVVAEPLLAPPPTITSPVSLVTITMTDKGTTRTITAPIDDLPPPPCGLKLSAFMYPEEAYWAHCPDYTSSTAVTPEPTPAITSSASMVTITVTDKGTIRTITDSADKLPPPPCGLKLSAFMYPEEAYWAHCPDYTSSTTVTPRLTSSVSMVTVTVTEETTTRTVTTTWNSAFDYQEEALWTHPPGNGESWSLPPPSTHTPTGLVRPAGPDWWKEPAFTSSTNAKAMVTAAPPTVESVPMDDQKQSSRVASRLGVTDNLSAMLVVVSCLVVVLL